ncbi:MAG TPA: head GIN domain-containing protein, partial [Candidatus Kapabacteria bacterium]|nr:head GIN domain-containing protein [Candidatus Kapabacteria bacterium]
MKKLLLLGLFILAVGAVSATTIACSEIRGSGKIISEKRSLSGFTGIDAGGAVELQVTQGNEFSVEVQTDDNIMPLIQTTVEDGTLHIFTKDHTSINETQIIVKVSLPKLESLALSGASKGTASQVNSDDLHLKVSGASKLSLDGSAKKMDVTASGASKLSINGTAVDLSCKVSGASSVKAQELKAQNVKVDCSGASKSQVYASSTISI